MLAEDPNFRQVHDRLSSESVFLYFDVASVEKEQQERMLQMQEEDKEMARERGRQSDAARGCRESFRRRSQPEFVPEEPPPAELGPPQPAEDALGTASD